VTITLGSALCVTQIITRNWLLKEESPGRSRASAAWTPCCHTCLQKLSRPASPAPSVTYLQSTMTGLPPNPVAKQAPCYPEIGKSEIGYQGVATPRAPHCRRQGLQRHRNWLRPFLQL
jgi:hypothetical protein